MAENASSVWRQCHRIVVPCAMLICPPARQVTSPYQLLVTEERGAGILGGASWKRRPQGSNSIKSHCVWFCIYQVGLQIHTCSFLGGLCACTTPERILVLILGYHCHSASSVRKPVAPFSMPLTNC